MAMFIDDEEVWKCRKHPSKRRTTGVCPVCLRDRLISLCPDCANVRPCTCCPTSSSSSSSSSSFFSRSSSKSSNGIGAIGRMSNLIDSEPAFRRSRSAAFPFLRRRLDDKDDSAARLPPSGPRSRPSFWSVFKGNKPKKPDEVKQVAQEDEMKKKMMRSRSVGFSLYPRSVGAGSGGDERLKAKGWYFPSPMKVFRHHKTPKVVQERSPLCRG
ncbi:PREDICTED: uncharacterized protein LOC104585616 [Nelumbo nucifera]|uniref:Uncharacterized protein LOC104585616 n=2 Tax=Nelumbo nucifera TaxID=4432 RepID=A0A1U7Z172_NELNU|nr:PREDICTED: uncharacterized protein LOC104585616 [Nelumbo nucifera]DAD17799.1 TPA_asm: hypothetical protein HUJ06_019262 [Nelumbo nucifera]